MTENERVKTVRQSLNLTLEAFGKRLGVGKTAISKIESGDRGLTDQMCRSICREFNVSETWLRTGEGAMTDEAAQEDALSRELEKIMTAGNDDFRKRLISALVRMRPEKWHVLEELALEIADQSPPPRNVHEWTRAEQDAAYKRQADAEDADRERGTGEEFTGSRSASGGN